MGLRSWWRSKFGKKAAPIQTGPTYYQRVDAGEFDRAYAPYVPMLGGLQEGALQRGGIGRNVEQLSTPAPREPDLVDDLINIGVGIAIGEALSSSDTSSDSSSGDVSPPDFTGGGGDFGGGGASGDF